MNTSLKKSLVCKLNESLHKKDVPLCFIGFDGFTDEIISVVDTRSNTNTFKPISTIMEFGKRIQDAAGKSTNIELVLSQKKIGGNAPIMTNALLEGGHRIIFAGAIGTPKEIEPLFQSMAEKCEKVFPLCPSAHSDALEFQDGKIIFGKLNILNSINYSLLLKHILLDELIKIFEETFLFVSANWTMLPHMNEIWEKLLENVIPKLSPKLRYFFVDLADPAKRSNDDLLKAVELLKRFNQSFHVILGLNEAEAHRLAEGLQITSSNLSEMVKHIQKKTQLTQIIIHPTKYATSATLTECHEVQGFFCKNPKLLTGAGDNFNAGYCHGILHGFSIEESLLCGVATSGYYVKEGKSPTISELIHFLAN